MSNAGRPKVYNKKEIQAILEKLNEYIDNTKIPIVAEFAYQNDIRRAALYEQPELAYAIKKLIDKKEAELERKGLETNNSMAIFSLKQLGWKDRQDITSNDEPIKNPPIKVIIKDSKSKLLQEG